MQRVMQAGLVVAALLAAAASWWISDAVFHRAPITTDEHSYVLQAHLFASGRVKYEAPPFTEPFRYPMIILDPEQGWFSRYPPGHALWLMWGAFFGNLYGMVALASALAVVLMARAAPAFGASRWGVVAMLLWSPFFLFTYGTLLSHTSGFLAAALMLLAYARWRQREQPVWAVVAGLAWGWLFINRTYTAVLMALPFAVHALWVLWQRRDRITWTGVAGFAGAACVGVLAIMLYNYWMLGHPLEMTYLFYDPTDKLGFGLRHHGPTFPAPRPVEYTFVKGMADLRDQLVLMDQWMYGFRGGLLVWLALTVIGWSRLWSPLLVSTVLAVSLGYVYFWYPGWNETGPIYFFEILPAMVLSAGCGVARLWHLARRYPKARAAGALAVCAVWLVAAWPFVQQEARFLQGETGPRRAVLDAIQSAPPRSIVFVRRDIVDRAWANHDLVFNAHGIEGDIVVARWHEASNRAMRRYFADRSAFWLDYDEATDTYSLHVLTEISPPLDFTVPIGHLHRHTGTNIWDPDNPTRMIRIARPEDPPGVLLFGRLFQAHPGRFRVEMDARASSEGAGDIVIVVDRDETSNRVVPVPVADDWQTVTVDIEVEDYVVIEPRVVYHGGGDVQIARVRVLELLELPEP